MRRIFAGPETVQSGRIYITDRDDVAYLSIVLRMKAGDSLFVSDGKSMAYETRIAGIEKARIVLDILSEQSAFESGKAHITLYQGLPKGTKLDEIVRKSTELGVYRIVPVRTERTIPEAKGGLPTDRLKRLRRIAEEAARQSRRIRVPEVSDIVGFADMAESLADEGYDLMLVLFELEEVRTLKQALRDWAARRSDCGEGAAAPSANIAVFVGPEGGFEQGEVERLISRGAVSVTVGDTILRTETAGPVAAAMIAYELEL